MKPITDIETLRKICDAQGAPEIAVYDGKWCEVVRYGIPNNEEVRFENGSESFVKVITNTIRFAALIYQPIPAAELPAKPAPEKIEGYEAFEIGICKKCEMFAGLIEGFPCEAGSDHHAVKSNLVWKLRKVEPVPVVKWWRHITFDNTCKTIDSIIVETSGNKAMIECPLYLKAWREITESEYLAATKQKTLTNECKTVCDAPWQACCGCVRNGTQSCPRSDAHSDQQKPLALGDTPTHGNAKYMSNKECREIVGKLLDRMAKLEDKVDAIERRAK